jgi:hypothetical protein
MQFEIKTKKTKTKQPAQPVVAPSYEEICEKFKNKEISGFETDTDKFRLFVAEGDILCYFAKGSSRRGRPLYEHNITGFKKFIYHISNNTDDNKWKIIDKYRRYATEASFSNDYIIDCLALPATREQWEADGKKSLYNYNVTTGVHKEGEVITIDGMSKVFNTEAIRQAIKNKTAYRSGTRDFRGYDASVSIEIKPDGTMCGYLSLEFRGTGNGHYYLLINDNCFIYYDLD